MFFLPVPGKKSNGNTSDNEMEQSHSKLLYICMSSQRSSSTPASRPQFASLPQEDEFCGELVVTKKKLKIS